MGRVGIYYPVGVDSTFVQGNFTEAASATYVFSVVPVHSTLSTPRAFTNVSVVLLTNYPWVQHTGLTENVLMSYTGSLS